MKMNGGEIVARALEAEGVSWTFGIPGTHNTELYDALERSSVTPILVTDEQSASFMADAVYRVSGQVGVANVVPGAGVTHCLSGVAEAYMDGVAMVVLTCGIRIDTGRAYQLHDIDQLAVLKLLTKGVFRPTRAEDIYPMLRRAFALARSGTPGPVAVEIPANFYLLAHEVPEPVFDEKAPETPKASEAQLDEAARLLAQAKRPCLYIGWGARGAAAKLVDLAELLGAPVATTIQGKGVFPESHPLWLWNGAGASAPPFARSILDDCDCLLAIGCRFGEVATASYGWTPPANLIHVDINPEVFNRNYPARLAVPSDAAAFVEGLLPRVGPHRDPGDLPERIAKGHRELAARRLAEKSKDRVTPAAFFGALQKEAGPRAVYVTDSGNGTFMAMEQLRLDQPGLFIGPVDYSCMGYAVPGALGAKLARPETPVVALAGDGALLMTGLELLTAAQYGIAPVVCVLRDGELGQIAQFQRTSLDRNTCSVLHPYRLEDLARAVRCDYLDLPDDARLEEVLKKAFETARAGRPVVVEVAIDYSEKTFFTKGVLATNFWRLPLAERARKVLRLAGRKLAGAVGKKS